MVTGSLKLDALVTYKRQYSSDENIYGGLCAPDALKSVQNVCTLSQKDENRSSSFKSVENDVPRMSPAVNVVAQTNIPTCSLLHDHATLERVNVTSTCK